jgi:tryptophanyl-tRNA synthetase
MGRVFSGIKPSGDLQLGNFLGAVQRWVDAQPEPGSSPATRGEQVFCVVDLHAMTVEYEPADLTARTREVATLLLAAGLDPERCLLFVQSHVGDLHAECTWLLNCVTTFGELRRQTQFKEKSAGQDTVTVALFEYPVLMAADILLYDTDEVPVGDDQRQHVELARDVAERFNRRFGATFVVPRATFASTGARVMDLQYPTRKMSKSDESPLGTVCVLDEPGAIVKKVKAAVTDSDTTVRYDVDVKPGVSNLLEIYAAVAGISIEAAVAKFDGGGYGALKATVGDAVVEYLRPARERYHELAADPGEVDRVLAAGAARARALATPVLERAKRNAGLLAGQDGRHG